MTAFIGVGSNIDPVRNIPAAAQELNKIVTIREVSVHYQTSPLHRPEQNDFINGVWNVETELSVLQLRSMLKTIEYSLGRRRTSDKNAAREIDLDILVYDDTIIDPQVLEREFLYIPLLELNPSLRTPDGNLLRDQVDLKRSLQIADINVL